MCKKRIVEFYFYLQVLIMGSSCRFLVPTCQFMVFWCCWFALMNVPIFRLVTIHRTTLRKKIYVRKVATRNAWKLLRDFYFHRQKAQFIMKKPYGVGTQSERYISARYNFSDHMACSTFDMMFNIILFIYYIIFLFIYLYMC